MTPPHAAPTVGQKCLTWLLLVAVALMGLTITRQQALGSLHRHADHGAHQPSAVAAALTILASDWNERWQQQKMRGHGHLLSAAAHFPAPAPSRALVHEHDHNTLERHHHAPHDASVVALDGAAEFADAADSPASGSSVLLPALGAAGSELAWLQSAEHRGPWPVGHAVAFVSRNIPPPLRPPAAR